MIALLKRLYVTMRTRRAQMGMAVRVTVAAFVLKENLPTVTIKTLL